MLSSPGSWMRSPPSVCASADQNRRDAQLTGALSRCCGCLQLPIEQPCPPPFFAEDCGHTVHSFANFVKRWRLISYMTKSIPQKILAWYSRNRRVLPWRRTHDPYLILVSEVMLQQTQVDRVVPKYRAFLKQFPTVKKLAEAKTAEVIRAWAGLGYNRRALFLQKTAQAVIEKYQGKFPRDLELLKQLPGVGDYTARAILSFAFCEPVPVIDTNHRRFYQRVFFGLRKKDDKQLLAAAEKIVPIKNAYDFNQALMDFGSLICLSKQPLCEICPIKKQCKAYPNILRKKTRKQEIKKTIPFRETNRYFRGRILDMLRHENSVRLAVVKKKFPELSLDRLAAIIQQLVKDELLVIRKKCILLP